MGINKEGKLFAIEREITYRDYTLKESFRSGCSVFSPGFLPDLVCQRCLSLLSSQVHSALLSLTISAHYKHFRGRKDKKTSSPSNPHRYKRSKEKKKKKAHKKSWTGLLPSLMQITLEVSCFVSRDVCRWCDVSYSYFLGRKIAPRKLWAYTRIGWQGSSQPAKSGQLSGDTRGRKQDRRLTRSRL